VKKLVPIKVFYSYTGYNSEMIAVLYGDGKLEAKKLCNKIIKNGGCAVFMRN